MAPDDEVLNKLASVPDDGELEKVSTVLDDVDHKKASTVPDDLDHKKAAVAPDDQGDKKAATGLHSDDSLKQSLKALKSAYHEQQKLPKTPDHDLTRKSSKKIYRDQKKAARAIYLEHKKFMKSNIKHTTQGLAPDDRHDGHDRRDRHDRGDRREGPSALSKLSKKFSSIARQFSTDIQEITQHLREAELEFTDSWRPGGRFRKRFCFVGLGKKMMKMTPKNNSRDLENGKVGESESGNHRCTIDYRTLPIAEEDEACFPATVPETNRSFTYDELLEATNWFSPESVIGEGGFGKVYRGLIGDTEQVVAVKQLSTGSKQGEREFRAEVDIISRVHHRHLVSLVGNCTDDGQRLLVYDFVPNGTLEQALHGKGRPLLDWATRLRIALGSARGLAYLHSDCLPRIIHRDIKASNILLDNQWEAQVSDFGLAKVTTDTQTHVSTRVMGTFGYLAPEYALLGQVTDRSDVYSFGVVLLELISGRKPVDMLAEDGQQSLVEWARPLLTQALEDGNVKKLADPKLEGTYDEKEMLGMIEAAAACIRRSSKKRPKMVLVARAIETLCEGADLTQGVKPGSSNRYDEYYSDGENSSNSAEMARFRAQATVISTILSTDYNGFSSSAKSGSSGSTKSTSSVFSSEEQPALAYQRTERAPGISRIVSSDSTEFSSGLKSGDSELTQSSSMATSSEEQPALPHRHMVLASAISKILSTDHSDISSDVKSSESESKQSGSRATSSEEQPAQPHQLTGQATAISKILSSDYSDISSGSKSGESEFTQSSLIASSSEEELALPYQRTGQAIAIAS